MRLMGGTSYVYAARFSSGTHKINIFMTADGKVGGYRVLPSWVFHEAG
jgi:hypothetical protein